MKCVQCGDEATAICKFCGRAVCTPHTQSSLCVVGFTAIYGHWASEANAIEIADAAWCGQCQLRQRQVPQ